ncbi:hypothetical protein QR98_0082010 [Sarcoptes scabiei]|uniref:Uncharacterized protein n=1 Tax=Sarcoptes scabiei TaxID=52283 RepID=A0A132AGT2_SARSC|nr:hypothetical protein QR98_0082010 [Sarcoptes scabiei]
MRNTVAIVVVVDVGVCLWTNSFFFSIEFLFFRSPSQTCLFLFDDVFERRKFQRLTNCYADSSSDELSEEFVCDIPKHHHPELNSHTNHQLVKNK